MDPSETDKDDAEPMEVSDHNDGDHECGSENREDGSENGEVVYELDYDSDFAEFDETVGYVEDIILNGDFQKLQNDFYEKYYKEFDDTEENKFIYTDIHKEYVDTIEAYVVQQLKERIPDFVLEDFIHDLETKYIDLDNEIIEIMFSFTNFLNFKDLILHYKRIKGGPPDLLKDVMIVRPLRTGGQPPEAIGPSGSTSGNFSEPTIFPQPLDLSHRSPPLDLSLQGTPANQSGARPKSVSQVSSSRVNSPAGVRPGSATVASASGSRSSLAGAGPSGLQKTLKCPPRIRYKKSKSSGSSGGATSASKTTAESSIKDDVNILVKGFNLKPDEKKK